MKNILDQAQNKINIIGKLLDKTFKEDVTKDGRKYISSKITVRVDQTYGGKEEVSEIPVSLFAMQFTNANKPNPGYKQITELQNAKSAQDVGIENADVVRLTTANIRENNFVTKSGQLVNGWQINSSFVSTGGGTDVATFITDLFIMDKHPETDKEGDETGRLVIKGGIVQYNGKLDVLEFIVEAPDTVDYIDRNWEINDTVTARGRIRVTAKEEKPSAHSSWGEDIPETTTRAIRELIITTGDDEGKEEDFAYDPTDIKKAFNVRKAEIEQLQIDAKNSSGTKKAAAPAAAPTGNKYSWE